MEASFNLGRIRGIPIGVHSSWLIVFGLLTYSLAASVLPNRYPDWESATYWVVGAISAILLFTSVIAHELGHAIVAQSRGIAVRSITLFLFGGVALLDQESEEPGDEFQIAIAGPAVSVVIALISGGIWLAARDVNEQIGALFGYLASANTILVIFNLIPAFPLDGGRVFRAIVWRTTNSLERATRVSAGVGMLIGFAMIAFGIFLVFQSPVSGIWLVAIGWFLRSASEQSYQQLGVERAFAGATASDLMMSPPVTVSPEATIAEIVEEYVLGQNLRGLPVVDESELIGIITLTDITNTPRAEWGTTTVVDRMTPREHLVTVTPTTPLTVAMRHIAQRDIHQLPVVNGEGRPIGLLTRNALLNRLQLHQSLPGSRERPRSAAPRRSGLFR